ncbi:MAG: hypothetical protein B7Y15_03100 [Bacteroidetes bacterium 24-39-8]|jgi:predicted alpha/beta hydrolase family esterase|nr:MAG: hypothetical protein B7Y76_05175 [Sphingobacteriia bacterium 35-40-5]OYZ52352.1 MAG: hypothetical protein B7Y15_03100 [Bacteroidetes bacterium 24-39-8]OZA66976.1 MAG: hypothetical protein B7X72_04590 [Sphingobacteriia bacterium 39-39-8]HQR93348.1 alpha/beta hydrolase [Sediminibacterium sp.]HQS54076.1 alpha/beta hydrolase [Sediminibacterium sp.]
MTQYLILPGLGNSGPAHWQTYFEQSAPNFKRVEQTEWDAPNCATWIDTIDRAVFANAWGSQLKNIGPAGHINADSGFGQWDEGLALLDYFEESLP